MKGANIKMKKFIILATVSITMILFIMKTDAITSIAYEPGSEQDPVITQSYFDAAINQIKLQNQQLIQQYTDLMEKNRISELKIDAQQKLIDELKNTAQTSDGFIAVQVLKNNKILAGNGTEIIIRSGKTSTIKGINGSMADVTAGIDLKDGAAITNNHLLISSRDDGRGMRTITDVWILVRGSYKIELVN